jgi:hypothetical protein
MKNKVPYFCWRDGRPRWEPGPNLRDLGLKGQDLKDDVGGWLPYDQAIIEAQILNLRAKLARLRNLPQNQAESRFPILIKGLRARRQEPTLLKRARAQRQIEASEKGYVYAAFAERKEQVKIGHSMDPLRRIRQLQTANGEELQLISVFVGDKKAEDNLLHEFSYYRIRGEWFRGDARLISRLKKLHDPGIKLNPEAPRADRRE